VKSAPDAQRESFHVPAIVQTKNPGERLVVAYEAQRTSAGTDLAIVAFDADRSRRWSWRLPKTNWEPSLAVGHNDDGSETVFYNDSRITAAFDPATGAELWSYPTPGQCQRQIASIDWNRDGVADVAVQSGDVITVIDGATGHALSATAARASYGGYIAATSEGSGDEKSAALAVHAIGGMTLVDSRKGTIYDAPLDDRRVESIPPVIGRVAEGQNGLFQVSGSGLLRRMSLDGTLVARKDLDVDVLTMTGAYVDQDDVVDLLVSTYQGELVAVSGADLRVLWRVRLDGPPGPAVTTDVDGDGRGEIVVISEAGNLHVLQASR
jgi:outer membrane protein assembly factor BamB